MNYSEIYEYRFHLLEEILEDNANRTLKYGNNYNTGYLIDICDGKTRSFYDSIQNSEAWLETAIIEIIKDILEQEHIVFYEKEYDTGDINKITNKKIKKHQYDFIRKINNKEIGFCFKFDIKGLYYFSKECKGLTDVDEVYLYQISDNLSNNLNYSDGYLTLFSIKDFFEQFISLEEYKVFKKYADEFNLKAKSLTGFDIIPIPSKNNIKSIKQEKINILLNNVCEDKNFSNLDLETIKYNYVNKKYLSFMLIDSDFSNSFISSEWYYDSFSNIYNSLDEKVFDKTGIVVGYLKSIEQLILSLIKKNLSDTNSEREIDVDNYKGYLKHYNIPKKTKVKRIPFKEENLPYMNTMLNSLINFLDNNKDLFVVSEDAVKLIIKKLNLFREGKRNGYLHADNLYTFEQVTNIRKAALELYSLLLGSLEINEESLKYLFKYNISYLDNETLYGEISKWAVPILKYSISNSAKGIRFELNHYGFAFNINILETIDGYNFRNLSFMGSVNNTFSFETDDIDEYTVYRLNKILTAFIKENEDKLLLNRFNIIDLPALHDNSK